MRTINATLEDALSTQKGNLILRVLTWADAAAYNAAPTVPEHTWIVKAFDIFSTSANITLVTENDYTVSNFEVFIIERGIELSGTEYTIESGLFFVRTYKEDYGEIKITGSSYPNQKISIAAGDETYQQVITAFCTAIGKTAVFKNSTDAWLDYQFLPTGKALSLNKAELFESMLKQKYTILVYEESPNNLVFYNQDSYQQSAFKAVSWASELGTLGVVATSGDNKAFTSTDAQTWTERTIANFHNDIAYSPDLDLFAAVGASVAASSPDGITWTTRTIPAGTYNAVAWSASLSLFVAVGASVAASSPDGITWTTRTIPAGTYNGAAWSASLALFVAVGASVAASSTDGTTWTSRTIPAGTYNAVAWSASLALFVAVGASVHTTSTDGTTWTGSAMTAARSSHASVMLADGRILITGGYGSGVEKSETYFGTITGKTIVWAAGSAMSAARAAHTINLLSDNRILIIGGYNSTSKAETYFGTISGNTITWAAGTAYPTTTAGHTATILSDDRVLVGSSSVYFGTISGNTITWAAGTAFPNNVLNHTATLLSDDRILITGGYLSGSPLAETHFGTISGNTITWAAGTALPIAIENHTATLLSDNRILITGGYDLGSTYYDNTYFGTISSNTITWAAGTALPATNSEHTASLASGEVIIAGGTAGTDKTEVHFGTISGNTINWKVFNDTYYSIDYSPTLGMFAAVGASVCSTSTNGITWTVRTIASSTWRDVVWADTLLMFVAVASGGLSRITYSTDGSTWQVNTIAADFELSYLDGPTSYLIRDQARVHYLWRDETAAINTSGDTTDPQWNLGFLETTASPPTTLEDPFYKIFLQKAPVRLDITDGDKIHFTPYWSIDPTQTIDAMMQVSEHLHLNKSPSWYQEIKSIIMFNGTEGGALPSTIERVAAYTPLVSTGFDGVLTPAVNNLQALAQAVDDLTLGGTPPTTTAANDFQVGDGAGAWIKKTLAQTLTILGIFADAASDSVYYVRRNATWTNAKTYFDTIYAALVHAHAASDITSGTMATARLGSGSASASTFLRGDQTWDTPASGAVDYDQIHAEIG